MTEKNARRRSTARILLPAELAIRLTLEAQDPTALIEATASLPELYSKDARSSPNRPSSDRLLPYDGALADIR